MQTDIISLSSIGEPFMITGRGLSYPVECPETYSKSDGGLLGKTIKLDGKLVRVVGIEAFAIETIRKGTKIGLLVELVKPYIPRRHFADLLLVEMRANPDIVVYVADLGYMMWNEIRAEFPDRFENVGAAEQLLVGAAVGAALCGKLPVVYSITPFLLYRPAETIRNYLDHEQINVKLVGAGYGADYAHDGFTHHIWNLGPTMACYPNLSLYTPERAPESLETDFKTFMIDPKPGLMVLRK